MRVPTTILLMVILTVSVASCPAQTSVTSGASSAPVLSNQDVVSMIGSGLSEGIVRAKIENSPSHFDTSPRALADLKSAGVPDSVILAVVSAKPAPGPTPVPAAELERISKAAQEKENAQTRCPGCVAVMISNYNPSTRNLTDDWLSKNQIAYMKERIEKARKDGAPHHFWFTRYRENADDVIVWSSSVGTRAYTMYVPHTTTSTTNISGDVSATAQSSSTSYQAEHGEREFVNVVATVYASDGKKLYEAAHQGNWRWSKPDKDCLEEALNYLVKQVTP